MNVPIRVEAYGAARVISRLGPEGENHTGATGV